MKPEEAIKNLKLMQAQIEWDYPMEYAAAIDTAIEALEKQIPMKPLQPEMGCDGKVIHPCGNCGEDLESKIHDYCPWCGQMVKWV